MESRPYFPKIKEFENNNIKECPFCNAILPLTEFNDHIFCHRVDENENGLDGYNVNNFGIQINDNVKNDQKKNNINNINNNDNKPKINQNIINNNINENSINENNINNNNQNHEDDDFFLFPENSVRQVNIAPELRNLNHINFINEDNSNPNSNNRNNINNNNNNYNNKYNNNYNNNNINNRNEPKNEEKQESFIDKMKNNVMSNVMNIKNYIFPDNKKPQDHKEIELLNAPIESLSPAQREQRSRLEEKMAYEKKILGIEQSQDPNIDEPGEGITGERVAEFIVNNANNILTVVDIIGCLCLHRPSIGRTAVRVSNFFRSSLGNMNNNNQNNNVNGGQNYDNFIRNHPELRFKDKDIKTIIKFLPVSEIREIRNNPNGGDNQNNNNRKCIICLSEFDIGDQVSALPCAHVFHNDCIKSWLKKHCQCPICKFDITLKSLLGF